MKFVIKNIFVIEYLSIIVPAYIPQKNKKSNDEEQYVKKLQVSIISNKKLGAIELKPKSPDIILARNKR